MGYKRVCLTCRKAFSTGREYHLPENCPECGNQYIFYNHKFKPPKKDDIPAWKVVSFLYDHGFIYQGISKDNVRVKYPDNLEDARKFVIDYKNRAITKNK